jgi:ABC-type oligopeptide transport system ATPase subunit
MTMLLEVTDLRKTFPARTGLLGNVIDRVHAVDGISFTIAEGPHWASSAKAAASAVMSR